MENSLYFIPFSTVQNYSSWLSLLISLFSQIFDTFLLIQLLLIASSYKYYISYMNQAQTLIELIANQLVEGNCQVLQKLANEEGLNKSIAEGIKTITALFQGFMQKSQSDLMHIEFYRDLIRRLGGEAEVSEDELNDYFMINKMDKQGVIPMIKKISVLKRSKETLQVRLSTVMKQNESLSEDLKKSMIFSDERSSLMESIHQYENKQDKLRRQCRQLEQELLELKEISCKYEKTIKKLQQECQKLKQINVYLKSELQRSSIFMEQQIKRNEAVYSMDRNRLENALEQIQQQSTLIQKLQQRIAELEEQLTKANFQEEGKGKEIFIGSNSILGYLGTNKDYTTALLETIQQQVNKHVVSMQSVYNFMLQSNENFHRNVDDKKNILLICMTEQNQVVGAFSSAGFSLKEEQGKTIAFLFKLKDRAINIYRLKPGKKSITYDYDYINFGNQQLCIQCGSNILSSFYVSGPRNSLHYQPGPSCERDTFLSNNEGESEVKLKNYQIVEVNFDSI